MKRGGKRKLLLWRNASILINKDKNWSYQGNGWFPSVVGWAILRALGQ